MLGVDISDVDIREFVENHLRHCINEAYYTYPKEYRQSEEYKELSIEKKLQDAIERLGIKRVSEIIADGFINNFLW